jgi:hypothetical protein
MIGSIFSSLTLSKSTESVADHHQGLFESHVFDLAGCDRASEFFGGHPGAHFPLQRLAPRRRVLNPDDLDVVDLLTHGRDRERELVHHETGIHAGAEERDVRGTGGLLEVFANLRVQRERQLFARGDDVGSALHQILELAGDLAKSRAR